LSTPSFKLVCRLADDWSTNAGEWIKTEFYNRTRGWFFLRFKIQLRKYFTAKQFIVIAKMCQLSKTAQNKSLKWNLMSSIRLNYVVKLIFNWFHD
jgi:hypothetical protein